MTSAVSSYMQCRHALIVRLWTSEVQKSIGNGPSYNQNLWITPPDRERGVPSFLTKHKTLADCTPARKATPMLRVVVEDDASAELSLDLDEICREGARRMLAAALELEGTPTWPLFAEELDDEGHRLVVATATPTAGDRHRSRSDRGRRPEGERQARRRGRPASVEVLEPIIAPWCRKSPKVSEVLPLMYLHGMSSGDFAPALTEFFGSDAGLSPSVVTRLTKSWQEEREMFSNRPRRCRLRVLLGRRGPLQRAARGGAAVLPRDRRGACRRHKGARRHRDGQRESTGSWADLLRDAKRRGMRAPVVMVGDGALGMWSALGEVFPETRHQSCWVHKLAKRALRAAEVGAPSSPQGPRRGP
jgi:putative transposase